MFLNKMFGPQIVFGSAGGSGGGGGGGSSSSSSSKKSSSGGKGSSAPTTSIRPKARPAPKPAAKPKGRNRDADMYAGSTYSKQADGSYKSPTSVTAKDLKEGNVSEFKSKTGTGSVVVARGTAFKDVPQVGSKPNSDVYSSKDVAAPAPAAPVSTSGSGSSAPVTAPETIDPADGVGGGRDGGGTARRKQSKTSEDKVTVKRKAEGVKNYKTAKVNAPKKGAKNPMAIKTKRT